MKILRRIQRLDRKVLLLYAILLAGIVLNLLFIIPNGMNYCADGGCGLWIGEWHYHDALWHIAVAENSFTQFPFLHPSAVGYFLHSYNYLLGLVIYVLTKVGIPAITSYFFVLPVAVNIFVVWALLRYFRLTQKSMAEQIWISFFTYFGSSFLYLLIAYRGTMHEYSVLRGFPVVTALQPSYVMSNIQFFLTLGLIFYVLADVVAHRWDRRAVCLHMVALALAFGLKFYSGFAIFIILSIGLIRVVVINKAWRNSTLSFVAYSVTSFVSLLIFYLPFGSQGLGFPFVWSFMNIPHTYTETHFLFYHESLTLGRYYLQGLQKFSLRLVAFETISAALFIIVNLGTRIVAYPYFLIRIFQKKVNFEEALLMLVGTVCCILPILFIQRSGGWYNTIQFMYVGLYLLGILSGLAMSRVRLGKRHVLGTIAVVLVVILTLPNNIFTLDFLVRPKLRIPYTELRALSALARLPPGVVLSFRDDKNSSYVPALGQQIGYLVDDEQAELLNLPIQKRRKALDEGDCSVFRQVDYVYLRSSDIHRVLSCRRWWKNYKIVIREMGVLVYKKR